MQIYSDSEGHQDNLKTLNEGPEENPDGVSLSQQLDQPGCSEQSEEANVEEVFLKLNLINILV